MKKTEWYVAVTVATVAVAMAASILGTIGYLETRFTDRINREIDEMKTLMETLMPQNIRITLDNQYIIDVTLPAGNYTVTPIPQPDRDTGGRPFLPPNQTYPTLPPDITE